MRPQLATSESNRALPPYQSGPFDRLGRGQRKRGESNAQGRSSSGFKPAAVANLLALPYEENGGLEPQRCYAHPHSKRRPRPWRVHSPQRIPRPV
jgi:hypothetical protein